MKIKSYNIKDAGTGEITLDYAKKTFDELLAFQGYGFCLSPDTVVEKESGDFSLLSELKIGDFIKAPNNKYVEVVNIFDNGKKDVFEVELENGKSIKTTIEHQYLCSDGEKHSMYEIIKNNLEIICENE